ncbi:MAG: hypothetical protein RLZZ481_378 [Pseudomonadota bacterium]|jgi:hypothetical protein
MHNHRQNYTPEPLATANRPRDYAAALVIGALLALALTKWWAA